MKKEEKNKEIVMQKRKYFIYKGFGHITWYYRNKREIENNRRVEVRRLEYQPLSNKFKVLTSRIIQVEIPSKKKQKKKKFLRKVMVKIGLKQKDGEEEINVEVLLDSGVTKLVMSSEFV